MDNSVSEDKCVTAHVHSGTELDAIPIPKSIYFGGAAFGVCFFVGVFKAMADKWGPDFYKKTLVCGGSAGSIIAMQIALGKDPKYAGDVYALIGDKTHARGYALRPSDFLDEYVDELLRSDENIHKSIETRFWCGSTLFYAQHQWHKQWRDNADLAACIKGGYNIPLYCSKCDKLEGYEVVDGAYGLQASDFPHGDDTLFVGACQNTAEINIELSITQMLIPSHGPEYDGLVQKGYDTFMRWDGRMKTKVGVRLPNYTALFFLWAFKLIQVVLHTIKNWFQPKVEQNKRRVFVGF